MLAVSHAAIAYARQHLVPTTLSPGQRNTSTSSQDYRARQAAIAAVLARRAEKPRLPSVAELTDMQSSSATIEYISLQRPGRRRVESVPVSAFPYRAFPVSAARSSEERARGRIGEPKDPSAPTEDFPNGREMSTDSRCGASWDDAAVKCGKECLSGCNGIQEMCYRDLPICDHINPAGRCWAWSGGVSDSWCVTASAMIDGSDRTKDKEQAFYNLCICEEVELPLAPLSHCRALEETTPRTQIVVGPEARTDKYIAPMKASHLPPRDAEMVAIVIEEGVKRPGLPESLAC